MKNIYIYCEGQTEEAFVNELLYPYFFRMGIVVIPIVCTTKRTASRKYRGGAVEYQRIKNEITILCKSHSNEFVTTMFDYYAMPTDTPGIGNNDPDIMRRINAIEGTVNDDIGMKNCRFHFMLHEFEGILFSDPSSFETITDAQTVERIRQIRAEFPTPEHINNSPHTAPSKRLEALIPCYAKVRNGTIVSKKMGLDAIIAECPHFREWIESLSSLA